MKRFVLTYSRGGLGRARSLRKRMTDAEVHLWRKLRRKQLGVHFRRQFPLGKYICDFLCIPARIVVEVDGSGHSSVKGRLRDVDRDFFLSRDFFSDRDVLQNLPGMLLKIAESIESTRRTERAASLDQTTEVIPHGSLSPKEWRV